MDPLVDRINDLSVHERKLHIFSDPVPDLEIWNKRIDAHIRKIIRRHATLRQRVKILFTGITPLVDSCDIRCQSTLGSDRVWVTFNGTEYRVE